ncbi:(d)CMP kinase [Sediminibacillus albus]|uniref:Cytidylate kinase n=1 Tax=Sediminibacillus albus TaxID=407036 RepID=A0A1G8VME7_9BACI|nr:(d)CMP kinase [Sediminibacillus albus]SDJ67117.1 cytidylate kinase [Sediminibacillus albus]
MKKTELAIAIDGPAAAGKSTVAKLIAKDLSYIYIDTGAMYRALTYQAINENVDLENERQLRGILEHIEIDLQQSPEGQKVLVNQMDVTHDIRTHQVTNNVSVVAKHPAVREEMVKRQKALALKRGVVMDGRDIGTHVLPDAEVKIFLIASVEERAGRRHKENLEKGFASDLNDLKKEIEKRDQLDSEREASPLLKAEDAIEIDTTSLSIQDVADRILEVVEAVRKK